MKHTRVPVLTPCINILKKLSVSFLGETMERRVTTCLVYWPCIVQMVFRIGVDRVSTCWDEEFYTVWINCFDSIFFYDVDQSATVKNGKNEQQSTNLLIKKSREPKRWNFNFMDRVRNWIILILFKRLIRGTVAYSIKAPTI